MALRQAESEVRGKGKGGAKIFVVVGEARESNWAAEEPALQIRGCRWSHHEVEGGLLLGINGPVIVNLQSWHVDSPSAFESFSAGDIKEIDDTVGNDPSTFSGPEPGVSVSVTLNEAGKRILHFRGLERSHQETDGDLLLDQNWTAAG